MCLCSTVCHSSVSLEANPVREGFCSGRYGGLDSRTELLRVSGNAKDSKYFYGSYFSFIAVKFKKILKINSSYALIF